MGGLTIVLVPLIAILWFVVPLTFSVAFFRWWQRVGHWSFALLSAAAALCVLGQACAFLASNIPFWKSDAIGDHPQRIQALVMVSLALYLFMGVLLLVGAIGLASAARDDFRADNAK